VTRTGTGLFAIASTSLVIGLFAASPSFADVLPANDPSADRATVVANYQRTIEQLLTVPTGWSGDTQTCDAGSPSETSQTATLAAVNYARELAGLPAVTLDPAKSQKAQASALIIAANNVLTHTPHETSRCWSTAGYAAASRGNIIINRGFAPAPSSPALSGATGPRAVLNYLADPGPANTDVGHRRWILFQGLRSVGNGDTLNSNTLYVVPDAFQKQEGKTWVPWPAAGYFPSELEPQGRWSLSYPNADFNDARVSVTSADGPLPVTQHPIVNGLGDNTLSWEVELPKNYREDRASDYSVTVTVQGVRVKGKTVEKTWTTTLVLAGALEPSGTAASLSR
jgi:hypothetical protein